MESLSIIIPCFNSKNTIVRCLSSIKSSLIDVEVIVVDDCSTISSEELILDYAKKTNTSIKFIKNEQNMGAGETRNRGIREASKKYITFLDSDDEFDANYFKKIMEPMKKNYDMIVYDALEIYLSKKTKKMEMFYTDIFSEGLISPKQALVYIKGSTCGKIYKSEIIKKNKIEFGRTLRSEDMVFTKIATSYMKKIYYIKSPLYIYWETENSLMHNRAITSVNNNIDAFAVVKNNLIERQFEAELNSMFYIEVLLPITNSLIQLGKSYKEIIECYKKNRILYNKNDYYRRYYSFSFRLPFFLFEHRLFAFYNILRTIYKIIKKNISAKSIV